MVGYESLGDNQLIHRVSRVDKDALEALYTRYKTPVYSLCHVHAETTSLRRRSQLGHLFEHLAESRELQP